MVVSRPPHIGFVLERSLGHVTHADNLSTILPRQAGIDAEILPIEWAVDGLPARIPVFNSNWTVRSGLRARRGIKRMHRARPLDALFIHTQVPAVLAAQWVRRIPTIVSLDATPLQYDALGAHYGHATSHRRIEDLKWRANRVCLRRAARVVAWSAWTKGGIVDGYGIDAGKVVVVPPGVTPSLWRPPAPRHTDGRPVRILFVGGDLVRKGGDVLLDAFGRLRVERAGDVELHLVTKAEVPEMPGVVVHRDLTPNSPALVRLYHECDIFCLPTRGDCLPMVLSEAGAAELPLVSTDVAAIPEIVRDGDTGLVVPMDDAPALAEALRTLVEQPELRRRLGVGARRHVEHDYDAEKNAATLVELLADIARERGSRSR